MMKGDGKITAIVITRNEERNIAPCLQTLSWTDEIIVIDACSTDRTAELARAFTERVIVRPWEGYGAAKNAAIGMASHEWVLSVDADERVPDSLAGEIRDVVRRGGEGVSVFEMARRAFFLGTWIRHSGWYPGYVPRLFRRESARYDSSRVHEKLLFEGEPGRLRSDLDHYTDDVLFHYVHKLNVYTSLAAADLKAAGRKPRVIDLIIRPFYQFFRMYVLRLGVLDGMPGLILSLFSCSYVFIKYAKLTEPEGGETR